MRKITLFTISLLINFQVFGANDKGFFWKINSTQSTVYLLGSIHFADESFYPLRDKIKQAFNHSQNLVVEIDTSKISAEKYQQLVREKGIYKNGTTIKNKLSNSTWLKLQQHLKSLNVDYEQVKYYKPGMMILTLAALQMSNIGLNSELGIDLHFIKKARQQIPPKKIIALETIEQQFSLFNQAEDIDLLLDESLQSLDDSKKIMDNIILYWKRGDNIALEQLLFKDPLKKNPHYHQIYKHLFFDRNHQMAKKIAQMLKQKGRYFVIVGSGHLIGEQSIIQLLSQKHYQVKRL